MFYIEVSDKTVLMFGVILALMILATLMFTPKNNSRDNRKR